MLQIVILAPLFVFCWYMRKWETQDLVPIRPMEGEELPCNEARPPPGGRAFYPVPPLRGS